MFKRYRPSAAAMVPLALIALSGTLHSANQYPNVKGYVDFSANPQAKKWFNYSGDYLTWSNPGTGVYRIVFLELGDWTYRPTLQVTARGWPADQSSHTCAGSLEKTGKDLVVTVTCKRNGIAQQMAFTAMIFDETSDAAYAAVASCNTCIPPGPSHNPWTKSTSNAVRVERFFNRTGVFFRLDDPAMFSEAPFPMALVTPIATNGNCQIYSVGSSRQQANEIGVEVYCSDSYGSPQMSQFQLLLMPPSKRTGYVLTRDDGTPWPGYVSNAGGQPVQVHHESTGRYRVVFPNLAVDWVDDGTVKVDAHAGNGSSCGAWHWYRNNGGIEVDVVCHNAADQLANMRFIVMATSRH
jgi:hypothetical protein